MAGLTGVSTQHMKLVSGYLNSENNPAAGVPVSSAQMSGNIVQPYGGMVGGILWLGTVDAPDLSNKSIGMLYCGRYQMVQFRTAVVRGTLVFWDTTAADRLFMVTQDETSNGGVPLIAGVVLNVVSAGNFGFIQIEGKATVRMRATLSATTRFIAWSQAGAGPDNATADGVSASATLSPVSASAFLGVAEAAPVGGGFTLINLKPQVFRQ